MNAIEIAKDTANSFMVKPQYVTINPQKVKEVAHLIECMPKEKDAWKGPNIPHGFACQIILYELIANTVNYCYWYGKSEIRIDRSTSTKMYSLLDEAFQEIIPPYEAGITDAYCDAVIMCFMDKLSDARFPMISSRMNHLKELMERGYVWGNGWATNTKAGDFIRLILDGIGGSYTLEECMRELLRFFPGYSNDIFLKRASLFFMMLYRRKGWFKDQINVLPIPVDYHIPNMLHYLGCMDYSNELQTTINKGELIPEGSLMECELRAASLVIAEMMIKEASITSVHIDDYLWLNRKTCSAPFHLTITASY